MQVFEGRIWSYGGLDDVVGAGLAPALNEGDRKGRPYTFRIRILSVSVFFK